METFPLRILPNDLLWRVSSFMTVSDSVRLSNTCHNLRGIIRTYLSCRFDCNYKISMEMYTSSSDYNIKKKRIFLITLNKIKQVENNYICVCCSLIEEYINEKRDYRFCYWSLSILRWKLLPLLDRKYHLQTGWGWSRTKSRNEDRFIHMFTDRRDKLRRSNKRELCHFIITRSINLCKLLDIKYDLSTNSTPDRLWITR